MASAVLGCWQRTGIDNTMHVPTARSSADPTKPNHTPARPTRKRQNNPTNGHTPSHIKSTHTRLTYHRMV